MEKFYSALVINSRLFPNVHQVFKPRYNKEFFKRLTFNIDKLQEQIEKRCRYSSYQIDQTHLSQLKRDSKRLIDLKTRIDRMVNIGDDDKRRAIEAELEEIEGRVMPIAVAIPNRLSKEVPDTDRILEQLDSDWPKTGVTRILSHTKLSYINNCYSKSVVGPNSSYYFGVAAKLHYGIRDYFTTSLEAKSFIPTSGLCLTKSALVEAVNSRDYKDVFRDPCRILGEESRLTTNHLVEASRESLVGFLTTLGHRSSNEPLRLFAVGSSYSDGSEWFDSDAKKVSQFETVHALAQSPSIEKYSMDEYCMLRDLIWGLYRNLGLPVRLLRCSIESMRANEYDAHRIDIWLPSRSQWIETARISHYLDYITVRTGMKRGHLIDSMVYDSRALIAAIIENNQTSTGKFVIPTVIENFMPHMSESEKSAYFRGKVANMTPERQPDDPPPVINAFNNYQQRRYLAKKPYLFGHSQRAYRNNTFRRKRETVMSLGMAIMFGMLLDWDEIWIDYVPTGMKRFLYDNLFRPARRVYWKTVYVGGAVFPSDTPFDGLDKSYYEKSMSARRKDDYQKYWPKGRFRTLQDNDMDEEKVADDGSVVDSAKHNRSE